MLRLPTFLAALAAACTATATEYAVPAGSDVGRFFATLPKDATSVVFSAGSKYASEGDIPLPPRRLLVIDGRGCELSLGKGSNGFTCTVADMREAMERTASRYVIKDFGRISGGRKAVDLGATLGSVVENCEFAGQSEAAVDLRFCLMASLRNLLVTNPRQRGIVLRPGDWPGATGINSQCNSSVLEQCRVYAMAGTVAAYTILNSGGVRLRDCVSEGAPVDYDIFLSATLDGDESRPAANPVVKSFSLSNFHVEHAARKASIYVNMPAKSVVDLENVYWNGAQQAPVVLYTMGQLNLTDVGWWAEGFWIGSRISAPRITARRVHDAFHLGKDAGGRGMGSVRLVDPLPGNDVLKLNYVKVAEPSR
jgi:hypothetical protein